MKKSTNIKAALVFIGIMAIIVVIACLLDGRI